MEFKPVCLLFICVALQFFTKAQELSSPFIIKVYTAQDGLPHNYVLNINQDSKGYLWVGTAYGLCKFDGVSFSPVNIKGEKNIVPTAGSILPDGKIWIWSREGEEVLYDGKQFLAAPDSLHKGRSQPGFDQNTTWDWQLPRTCLGRLETPAGRFLNYFNDIVYEKRKGDSIRVSRAENPGYFTSIMGYTDQQLYYYTDQGLYAWSEKKLKPLFEKQLAGKRIYSCYRDSKKRFWIGTRSDGVYISKPGEEYRLDYHIRLGHNLISGFFEDKEGNIWIGGIEGLIKVQDIKYEKYDREKYPFLWDVNLVSYTKNNEILIFSETYGVIRKSKERFILPENNLFKHQLIDALCYDSTGKAWCASRQGRLLTYDGRNSADLTSLMKKNTSEELYLDIAYDEFRNKIWIISDSLTYGNEKGFSVFCSPDKSVIRHPAKLMALPDGRLLVATLTNDLFLIDRTDRIQKLNTGGLLIPKNILYFYLDPAGDILISVIEKGLIKCRLDKNGNLVVIKKYNTENSLKNNFVLSVAFDKQNRMWVSTMAGISIIDIKTEFAIGASPVWQIGIQDGLPEFRIGYDRLACDEEGNMWYTNLYTVSKFKVNEMNFPDHAPQISIEKVQINLKETDWSQYYDSLSPVFRLPDNPVLKHFENTITLSFNAVSMIYNGEYQYSYLLQGLNNNWSAGSPNNSLTFSKLKPGEYTFFVRARTSNMSWSTPAKFKFTILKPFWQQWWFRILVIMALIGIMYGIYKMRIRQIQKVLEVRKRIAGDLHDDLGSTLNSVKVYANLAALEKENVSHLEKVKESSQEAIAGLRDIIWVLDDKKDTLDHVLNRIRQFAEPLCTAAHIQFRQEITDIPAEHKLGKEEKRNLYMILKESVNNSIKYAGCKNISLNATLKNRSMEIVIADDGIGFEAGSVNYGNGLKNIQSRVKEIGYTVIIDSVKGKGTTITLAGG